MRKVSCTRSSARWTSPTSRKTREKTSRAVRRTSSSKEARSPLMLFRTSASSDSLKVSSVHQRERCLDGGRAQLFRDLWLSRYLVGPAPTLQECVNLLVGRRFFGRS